jgi:hypothetical protein
MGEVVWPHPPEAKRQSLHGYWPNVKASLPSIARVVVCCSGNAMINLRLDFHGWKFTLHHWLPIEQ